MDEKIKIPLDMRCTELEKKLEEEQGIKTSGILSIRDFLILLTPPDEDKENV
jgi:hypothetical protein